jgi:hypothetical protein
MGGDRQFVAPNEPAGLAVNYWLKADTSDPVRVRVTDASGEMVAELDGRGRAGLQTVVWDFRRSGRTQPAAGGGQTPSAGARAPVRLAPPGDYMIALEIGTRRWTTRATVRPAPERR